MLNMPFSAHRNRLFVALAMLLIAVVFLPVQRVIADDTQQTILNLEQDARDSIKQKDYTVARDKFRAIVQQHPTAIVSQGGLTRALIRLNDFTAAQVEADKLLSDYSTDPNVVRVIRQVADDYCNAKRYPEATQLYQTALTRWPADPDAIWCQRGLASIHIRQENFSAADTAVAKLVSDYFTDPKVARIIRQVADDYRRVKQYAKAAQLYQTALTNWPIDPDAMWCQRGLASIHIRQENFSDADTAVAKLVSGYSAHQDIAKAIRRVADDYCKVKQYPEAIQFYQVVLTNWPTDPDAMWCQRGLASIHIRQGNFADADTAAAKLVSDYSAHRDFAWVIRRVADDYYYAKRYTEAVQLYQTVLTHWPADPDTMWCLWGLARSQIILGDITAVDAAMTKLVSDHSNRPDIVRMVLDVAGRCRSEEYYAEAAQLYQICVQNWPGMMDAADTMWCDFGKVYSQIKMGDFSAADIATDKFCSDYSTDPEIVRVVQQLADCYLEAGKEEKAMALYKAILLKVPSFTEQNNAHAGIARIYLSQGNEAGVQSKIDYILENYDEPKEAARAIFVIGEEYYLRADEHLKANELARAREDYQKAITIWENNINQVVEPAHQCHAYYYSAVAYQRMGDIEKAVDNYRQVVDRWPDYKRAWYALYSITKCYDKLAEQEIPDSAAVEELKQGVYRELLEKYPDCAVAKIVQKNIEKAK